MKLNKWDYIYLVAMYLSMANIIYFVFIEPFL